MKVCARHQQAYDDACPYCEPVTVPDGRVTKHVCDGSGCCLVVDLRPLAPGYDANGPAPAYTYLLEELLGDE